MKTTITIFVLLLLCQMGWSQEYPDRHNTTLENSWLSCQQTQSPNPLRGVSHWIMYDLATTYSLHRSTFWNVNAFEHSDEGTNDLQIDYSLDGVIWKNFGRYSLTKADEISTYQGELGPDFNGLVAKFILITSLTNYGGTCHGLSEFKVESTPVTISDVSDLELDIDIVASPNPFNTISTIRISDLPEGGELYYKLLDMTGKVLQQNSIQSNTFTIDGTRLLSGIYNLTVVHPNGTKTIQINNIN